MSAFATPEDLREYCLVSQGREPVPTEYWNAACEYMEEKLTSHNSENTQCECGQNFDMCSGCYSERNPIA